MFQDLDLHCLSIGDEVAAGGLSSNSFSSLNVGFYKRSSSIGCLYWIISTGLLATNMFNYISGTTQSGWSICALSLSMSVLLVSVLQCVPNSATLLTASVSAPFSTEDCPALYLTE